MGSSSRLIQAAVRHDRARVALRRLHGQRGGAVGLGQTLAMIAEGMPREFRTQMGALDLVARPVPWCDLAHELVSLPDGIGDALRVDPEPLATSFVGQVHRAKLDGDDVIVKVLHPVVAGPGEGRRAAPDLREEARSALQIAEALAPWPRLRVAATVAVSERVLVAAHLDGQTLHALLPPEGSGPAHPNDLATLLVAAVFGPVFRAGLVNADAHPRNFIVTENGIGLVDFGAVRDVPDVPALSSALDVLLEGLSRGGLSGLGVRAAGLDAELAPLLDPLGPGAWPFGDDDLMDQLGAIKRGNPLEVGQVGFDDGRVPRLRAAIGVHHALCRMGLEFALGDCLANLRETARDAP
jgi:hypothetical protein